MSEEQTPSIQFNEEQQSSGEKQGLVSPTQLIHFFSEKPSVIERHSPEQQSLSLPQSESIS
jgi:hypothetical protein